MSKRTRARIRTVQGRRRRPRAQPIRRAQPLPPLAPFGRPADQLSPAEGQIALYWMYAAPQLATGLRPLRPVWLDNDEHIAALERIGLCQADVWPGDGPRGWRHLGLEHTEEH